MSDFINQQVNPPESWVEFEKLSADLWALIWNDPNTQMNGRSGQAQHGVDVFGYKDGSGDLFAVQCKGKDGRYGMAVTEKELKEEVEKAKTFTPKISEFTLASTAQNDAKVQKAARLITEEHQKSGLFRVNVMGWSEIHRLLANYPDLVSKYYPDQSSSTYRLERCLSKLLERKLRDNDSSHQIVDKYPAATAETILTKLADLSSSTDTNNNITSESEHLLNDEIDEYRTLLIEHKPKTALALLEKLKNRRWRDTNDWLKFRIETNIASANLKLGKNELASKGFLSALAYAPDDEKAMCNATLAHILNNNFDEAINSANLTLQTHPQCIRGYTLLISASIQIESITKAEELVPDELHNDIDIIFSFYNFYHERNEPERAFNFIEKAYNEKPNDLEIKIAYSSLLLDQLINQNAFIFDGQGSNLQQSQLDQTTDILEQAWEDIKPTEYASRYLYVANNLITSYRIANNFTEAFRIIDEALNISDNNVNLKRIKSTLYLEISDYESAFNTLSTINETDHTTLTLLQMCDSCSLSGDTERALELLEKIDLSSANADEIIQYYCLNISFTYKTSSIDNAKDIINDATDKFPTSIRILVDSAITLREATYNDEALEYLNNARSLITTDTKYSEILYIANAFYSYPEYIQAAELYSSVLHSFNNSSTLRKLLICYYESDQRKECVDLLERLPNDVKKLSFFRRLSSATYIRIGDLDNALKEINEYLTIDPKDLNVRLNWVNLQIKRNSTDEVINYFNNLDEFPNAHPIDLIYLAELLDYFGFHQKALDTAYTAASNNPLNADVQLGYIGLLLFGKLDSVLIEPTRITYPCAFSFEDSAGNTEIYLVTDEEQDIHHDFTIKSSHPIAKSALGKATDDIVTIKLNAYQTVDKRVSWIKSKYLYLLHKSMEAFSTRFPDNNGLISFSLENPNGEGITLDPILNSLSDRHAHVQEVLDLYEAEHYPIGIVAKRLGIHPLEIWRDFLIDESIKIFCCDGTHSERNNAITLIKDTSNQYIIDPLTLFSIYTLGVHEAVHAVTNNLAITQSSLDLFIELIQEKQSQIARNNHSRLVKHEDKYIWIDITKDELETDLELFSKIYNWANDNLTKVPAIGNTNKGYIISTIKTLMHQSFTDTILAAENTNRLLLSDDHRLRMFAKSIWDVDGVWLQSILLVALEKRLIDFNQYSKTVISMIQANLFFTTLNHVVLNNIAELNGWRVTNDLSQALSTLGKQYSDLNSSIKVAKHFLDYVWSRSTSNANKESLTFALLNALTNNYTHTSSELILEVMSKIPILSTTLKDPGYMSSLNKWKVGHFIA